MCLLLESIKIFNNQPQNLEWHESRLNSSRRALFGSGLSDAALSAVINTSALDPAIVYKARVLAGRKVEAVEFVRYERKAVTTLRVIEAPGLSYAHKFAGREALNALFEKRQGADDVLIARKGLITDTSYANCCFWDGSEWVTPQTPLLKGTKRAFLLHTKAIQEKVIATSDLGSFEKICLINSMLDLGEVQLPISQIIH